MRRVLRIAGKFLVGLVVLALLGFAFIHTPWGKSLVRGVIESKLAAKVTGKVHVGSVDYTALFRTIELHDVEIRDRDDQPAIAIRSIEVDLDRGSVLHGAPVLDRLAVDGVDATIVQRADGTTNLTGLAAPSDEPPPASFDIAELSLHGAVHVTRADGTKLDLAELVVAGTLSARPRANELDVVLGKLSAAVTIAKPGAAPKHADLAIARTTVHRRADGVDVDIADVTAGPVSVAAIAGHVALANGALAGEQSLAITTARIDHTKLERMLDKALLVDDVVLDAKVSGPPSKLAIHGTVQARRTRLALDGTADATIPARPRYDLSLVGSGESQDLLTATSANTPEIETTINLHVVGSCIATPDLDAVATLAIGPTHIGSIAVGQLTATAHAQHGGIAVDQLDVTGIGFTIHGSGGLDADTRVHGQMSVAGSPAEALHVLREAGIAVPIKVPPIPRLELGVSADGFVDGKLALTILPAKISIAGGHVDVVGTAQLDHKQLEAATTTITAGGIDIDALARLTGKPAPRMHGSIGGKLVLERDATGQRGAGTLTIALREPALTIVAHTDADMQMAKLHADLIHAGAKLGTIDASLAHDMTGVLPDKPWHVVVDVPAHALAELAALAPHPPANLPDAEVKLHVDLAGTPRAPRGSIDATFAGARDDAFGAKTARLHATIGSSRSEVTIAATSSIVADAVTGPLANVTAMVQLRSPYRGAVLDLHRMSIDPRFTAKVDVPIRELASIPKAPADLGGSVAGTIVATGTPSHITLGGQLAWTDYPTAAGVTGSTEIDLSGTLPALAVHVRRDGLDIDSKLVRDGARTTIDSQIAASAIPLAKLVPAKFAHYLDGAEPGTLDWNMHAALVLDGGALQPPAITGTLAIHHGAFAVPHTDRRWHDIALEVAGDPAGLRLTKLELHESDKANPDRTVSAHGLVTLDRFHPQHAEVELAVHDWLLLGKTSPIFGDAPTARLDLDAMLAADLAAPIVTIDATISRLSFVNPDRQERGHQPELSEVSSDVIYVSADQPAGKLPVPPPPAAPHPRRPIDIHVHLPQPIHAVRTPFDVMASGDVDVKLRDDGVAVRGKLAMTSGTLFLFGRLHDIVDGSLSFTDEHPKGWFHVVAARQLPPEALHNTTRTRETLTLTGSPTAPAVAFDGAAGDTIPEVLSTYNAGHTLYATRPGLPASSTVEMPRGDQMMILGFVSLALPHLLFLDSIEAWADPSEPRGAYGRIRNLEAERYFSHRTNRVRAVGRPTQPGRSTAELQLDHLWIDDAHATFGAGVRAGDRLGGGLGIFFEWSSAN